MIKNIWIWVFLGALFPPLFFIPLFYFYIIKPLKNGTVEGGPIVFYGWGLFLSTISLLANLPIRSTSRAFLKLNHFNFSQGYIFASFVLALFTIFCYFYSLRNDPERNKIIPFKEFTPDKYFYSLFIFSFVPLIGLAVDRTMELKDIFHPFMYAVAVVFKEHSTIGVIVGCIVISILTALNEEIFFRGILFKHYDQLNKFGRILILSFSTILFTVSHLPVSFIFPLIFAIFINKMRIRSNNLLPNIIIHSIWNLNVLIVTLMKLI